MKWKVASLSFAFLGRAFTDGDPCVEYAIKQKINSVRAEWANLEPIARINEDLRASAKLAAEESAEVCAVTRIEYGCDDEHLQGIAGYDRVGETQWLCKGAHCAELPDETPAGDWSDQGECYRYAPCSSGDKLGSCGDDTVVSDFTQVMWETHVVDDAFVIAGPPQEIGCSKVNCVNEPGVVVICQYGPGGNSPGAYPFSTSTLDHLDDRFPSMGTPAESPTTPAPPKPETSSTPPKPETPPMTEAPAPPPATEAPTPPPTTGAPAHPPTTEAPAPPPTTEAPAPPPATEAPVPDEVTFTMRAKINELRMKWAGLQPIVKFNTSLRNKAESGAKRSAASCLAEQGFEGSSVTGFRRTGELQWVCKGAHCATLPADQAVVDWANQGGCYQYGFFGEPDVLASCGGAYVHDFTQLFWDTINTEDGLMAAAPTSIGCHRTPCEHEEGEVVVCRFGPGGNLPGEVPFTTCALNKLAQRFPNMGVDSSPPPPPTTTVPVQEVDPGFLDEILPELQKKRHDWGGLPPLNVNDELLAFAQKRASENAATCSRITSSESDRQNVGGFGQLAESVWGCHGTCTMPAGIAVSDWCQNAQCYVYSPYGSPDDTVDSEYCSYFNAFDDFLKMFWDTEVDSPNYGPATDVGCGKAWCHDEDGNQLLSHQVVCVYGPAGNVLGEYPFSEDVAAEIAKVHENMYPPPS